MTGSQRIENDLGKVDSVYSFMTGLINEVNDDVERYCSPKVSEGIRREFDIMCKVCNHTMRNVETILDEGGWANV